MYLMWVYVVPYYSTVSDSNILVYNIVVGYEQLGMNPPRRLKRRGWTGPPWEIWIGVSFSCGFENTTWLVSFWLTSSTAQGGGGSFKNRKPIGEVGCCESGMAERIHGWTERCLRSPLCLSLSLTIYLPIFYVSIYLSLSFSLSSN